MVHVVGVYSYVLVVGMIVSRHAAADGNMFNFDPPLWDSCELFADVRSVRSRYTVLYLAPSVRRAVYCIAQGAGRDAHAVLFRVVMRYLCVG